MLMQVYKPGQGKYTRLCSGFTVAIVVAMGCWQLYKRLEAGDVNLWIAYMVPVGVFVAAAILVFWLVNKVSLADFLIASEGELKKVNWSSRKEITVSTLIVIIVVVTMAVLLGATDMFFQLVFGRLLG